VDAQCDKLAKVIGHQFITLTVYLCVQHDGCNAAHQVGGVLVLKYLMHQCSEIRNSTAAAETCYITVGGHVSDVAQYTGQWASSLELACGNPRQIVCAHVPPNFKGIE